MKKEVEKKFFVFEIIPSEFVAFKSLYEEENTCYSNSVC